MPEISKEPSPKTPFHVNLANVTGLLASIIIAVMILLLQSSDKYPYFDYLLTLTGVTAVALIFATYGRVHLGANYIVSPKYPEVVRVLTTIGLVGVMLVMVLVVLPFSYIGSVIIGLSGVVFFWMLMSTFRPKTS